MELENIRIINIDLQRKLRNKLSVYLRIIYIY